jgi:uncharacterized membrane protein
MAALEVGLHAQAERVFVTGIHSLDLTDQNARFFRMVVSEQLPRFCLEAGDIGYRPTGPLSRKPLVKLRSYIVQIFKGILPLASRTNRVLRQRIGRYPDVLAVTTDDLSRPVNRMAEFEQGLPQA